MGGGGGGGGGEGKRGKGGGRLRGKEEEEGGEPDGDTVRRGRCRGCLEERGMKKRGREEGKITQGGGGGKEKERKGRGETRVIRQVKG